MRKRSNFEIKLDEISDRLYSLSPDTDPEAIDAITAGMSPTTKRRVLAYARNNEFHGPESPVPGADGPQLPSVLAREPSLRMSALSPSSLAVKTPAERRQSQQVRENIQASANKLLARCDESDRRVEAALAMTAEHRQREASARENIQTSANKLLARCDESDRRVEAALSAMTRGQDAILQQMSFMAKRVEAMERGMSGIERGIGGLRQVRARANVVAGAAGKAQSRSRPGRLPREHAASAGSPSPSAATVPVTASPRAPPSVSDEVISGLDA